MANLKIRSNIPTALQDAGIDTFADLFCGIGGFHYAAEDLGLRCAFASEIDKPARAQYQQNFGIEPKGDIKRISIEEIPDHDILFGGFPCQPFSIIGEMKGFEDERGDLFLEILRVLRGKKPKAFVLENVRQLTTIRGGRVMARIVSGLEESGYEVDYKILNALDCGLPQKRERVIIVGFLDDSLELFQWPKKKPEYKPLAEVLEAEPHQRHFVSAQIRAKRHGQHKAKTSPAVWHENKGGNISSHPFSCALRANASYNYLLVDGERRLTPREQLRLQGFPDTFEIVGNDGQIRKQTGNAVPVPMVRAVLREVMGAASKNQRRNLQTRTISDQRVSA